MPIPLGVLAVAGAGAAGAAGAYEWLETQVLGTAIAEIEFTNLGTNYGSTYQHLQIRMVSRTDNFDTSVAVNLRFNGDDGANYSHHALGGEPSFSATPFSFAGTSTTSINVAIHAVGAYTSNLFGATIVDILDPFNTNKYTTTRSLSGNPGLRIDLKSGNWRNTAAISSLKLISDAGSFIAGSRFSLYGIRSVNP